MYLKLETPLAGSHLNYQEALLMHIAEAQFSTIDAAMVCENHCSKLRDSFVIMMPITRFSLANCKIGNVDEVCLRKLKKSEIFLEVGSVDVDRINHFYDFACEDVIQILPSCHCGRTDVFGQQRSWTVVKCGIVCNATECVFSRLKSHCTKHSLHLTLHCSICGKPFLSINSVASHNPHSMKASGVPERPSESS
ncbi:Protein kinase C-like [Trichinella spiralis]|uniref:Protein kinase C-like n=1 Tax=Trichinella spiralis TaxID=6334 RepID=A0ABR3KMA3_TRISP